MPLPPRPLDAARRRPRKPWTGARLARTVAIPVLLAALVTAGTPGWGIYRIRSGDTLSEIAQRYHTTVAKLVQVNRLPGNGNRIYAGESLKVPTGGGTSTRWVTTKRHHRVGSGDTLIRISHRYGVPAWKIARANRLPSSRIVRLGDTLVIPVRSKVTTGSGSNSSNTFAGRTYSDAVVSAAARNRAVLARRDLPSTSQMRSLIVAKARANGVDPALALAVSWQEAGWNMRHVSVANAIGAMQVLPSTGEWISGVIGRRLDLLKPADNVTAGVVLLKILTRAAGERNGIAGYYQGLKSVREKGMYPDTKRYVANILALKKQFD